MPWILIIGMWKSFGHQHHILFGMDIDYMYVEIIWTPISYLILPWIFIIGMWKSFGHQYHILFCHGYLSKVYGNHLDTNIISYFAMDIDYRYMEIIWTPISYLILWK